MNRWRRGRCRVALAFAALLAGCQAQPQASPSPGTTPSAASLPSATPTTVTAEHPILDLGPFSVGNLACDSQRMAFSTSSTPRQSRSDMIKVAGLDGSNPRVLARASHGGTLTDAVPLVSDWVLFLEYAQAGDGPAASFWYLSAANLGDGHLVTLAAATAAPGTLELPTYALSGTKAVWAQMTPDGSQALFTQDLVAGNRSQVALPPSMRPFSPSIAGSTVVFVDGDTTRSMSADEQHPGSLQRLELGTAGLLALERQAPAYAPVTNGKDVIWTTDAPDPLHPGPSLVWSPVIASIDGGEKRQLATVGDLTLLSDAFAVWPDHETRDLFAYRLQTRRLSEIRVAGRDDLRAVLALCGATLLYALPPGVDGDRNVIRSIDLDAVVPR